MMMSMASNIREQARRLRSQQQGELHRERELSSYSRDVTQGAAMEREVEQWLSGEELEELEEASIRERNQETTKMLRSMNSLNALNRELQSLVIEQGSLLDRIDQNIDHTV
jgi:syntaxin 16